MVLLTRRALLPTRFRLTAGVTGLSVGGVVWTALHDTIESVPPSFAAALVIAGGGSVLFDWIEGLRRQVRSTSARLSIRDAQLTALIHVMPVALLLVDSHGIVGWSGGSLLAELGLIGSEGQNAFSLLDEIEGASVVLTAGLCGRGEEAPVTIGERSFRLSSVPWAPVGKLEGSLLVAMDVSSEAERERALEKAIEDKDGFISSLSHELMTPLTAVMGFAQILAPGSDEDLWPLATREIWREAARMAFIIDNLMVFGRLRMTRVTTRSAPVVLDEVVDDALARMPWIDGPITRVRRSPTRALADAGRTRIVIQNLVVNAVAHGGESVEVEIGGDADRAWVEVRDSGPEIEDPEAIFIPYQRRRGDTMPSGLGTGLSVARGLARQMGGDVVYRHESGWSRFRLVVPAAPSERA